jgi:hypothetical protein
MKHIKLFESNKDNPDKLRDLVDSIRNIFIDFEDSNIIHYDEYTFGYRPGGNYDRFIELLQHSCNRRKLHQADHIKINCVIEIPINDDELNKDGIGILEDIIIAIKRLESLDYKVTMNLNGNHHLYKSCKIIIKIPMNLL